MNIKSMRMSKNLTQEALGKLLGVGRTTVAMWETGKIKPQAGKLPELARIFGCTIDELFGNEPV